VNELDTGEQPGIVEQAVRRHRGGAVESVADHVGQEWPVALVFNGISHAVMMCTPRDLEEFAVGFAISEGIVERGAHIQDIEVEFRDGKLPHAEVQLTVVQQAFAALKEKRRALSGRTGCGVCGIESIDLLDLEPEQVPDTGFVARLAPDAIARAARELPQHQALTKLTGGLHAAALFSAAGELLILREDIGRHNAVDKLIGAALAHGTLKMRESIMLVSGRAGFELVQKALVAGLPVMAAVGAPSSLAVAAALRFGMTLLGFVRDSRFNIYSGEWRIT